MPAWKNLRLLGIAAVLSAMSPLASATTSSWHWSGEVTGYTGTIDGTAQFWTEQVGANAYRLHILMTNTATTISTGTAQALDGLYFDLSPSPGPLSMVSAVAIEGLLQDTYLTSPIPGTAGANICAPGSVGSALAPTCGSTLVGGWQLSYQPTTGVGGGAAATQKYGIGTTGQTGAFNGVDVNPADYAILPRVGMNPTVGMASQEPYAYGSAEFVLGGLTTDQITISNVEAAYGTAPEGTPAGDEGPPSSVPEPATWTLGAGIALFLASKGIRRRAARAAVR